MGIYSRIYSQSEAEITNWIYDRHPELEGLLEFPVCNQLVISTRTTYAWGWHLKWRVVSWDWAIFTYEILLCLAGESVIIELNWTLLHPAGIKELFVGEGESTHTHTHRRTITLQLGLGSLFPWIIHLLAWMSLGTIFNFHCLTFLKCKVDDISKFQVILKIN